MKEKSYQQNLKRRLQEAGWFVHKVFQGQYGGGGWPDLLAIKEVTIYIEVKINGKEPTSLQRSTLQKIADAGALALVLCCDEDGWEELTWAMPKVATRADLARLIKLIEDLKRDLQLKEKEEVNVNG